ncbi:MAG: cytochrome P450 [Mycolicibacterium cosmeticum]|nr:cytochrome P450 [Mycolicibacterium cosmeticum]
MVTAQDFFAEAVLRDPYPLYDRLRATPVQQVGESGFFVVSAWDAVVEATQRTDDFSSHLTATMVYRPDGTVTTFEMDGPGGPTHVLATADDPVHAVHRKLVLPRMMARRMRELEPFITTRAVRLFDTGCASGAVEWMSEVADRLPMMVVAHLLGLPDTDVPELVRRAYASTQLLDGLVDDGQLRSAALAATELGGYLIAQFDDAAADPGDNLLGDLATCCATGELDPMAAALMLIQLVGAGAESTAGLLGNAAWLLTALPDIQRQLRADAGTLAAFIEEVLRYESPFRGHYRHVVADTTLAGTALPAGSRLLLLWGAANRDPAQFPAPGQFRLDRPGRGHMTFGKGLHFCVGAALARLEARIVLQQLLERTNWLQATAAPDWLPSVLVRRPARLDLRMR